MLDRAIALAAEELMLNPSNIDARVAVAEYHAKLGHRQVALQHAAEVSDRDDPHITFFLALVHAQLGDEGTAVDLLRKARTAGLPAAELAAWPELESLQRNPTFQKLVKAAVIN